MILKNQIIHFQELFTESKKTFLVVGQRYAEVGYYAHFSGKMYGKIRENRPKIAFFSLKKAFNLAPDHFQNPIFGQVVPLYGLYKRWISLNFEILVHF